MTESSYMVQQNSSYNMCSSNLLEQCYPEVKLQKSVPTYSNTEDEIRNRQTISAY